MSIRVTKRAVHQLTDILKTSKSKDAIFYVKGGGCNGLEYVLEPLTDKPDKFDDVIPLDKDHNIVVCGKSMMYLMGTSIDWKKTFMGESFLFDNPNVQNTCGCGATFSPKNKINE
jgi:iron-sulfur cluster assembly protein